MRKVNLALSLFVAGLFLVSCGEQQAPQEKAETPEKTESGIADGTYELDIKNSVVEWKGTMLGVKHHTGTLNFQAGKLSIENGAVTAGTFIVDMNSMRTTDDNYNPEEGQTPDKLIEHLKSDDFFLTSEYPTATFVLSGMSGNEAKGEMTIRGNTNDVKVSGVSVEAHGDHIHGSATAVLDRQKYDVKFSHPLEEMVLSDDLEIKVNFTANKN